MNNIETLLQQHAEGTLTPEERLELDHLTHRDAVLQAAVQGASQIRRRRRARISAVASVVLVAGSFFILRPTHDDRQAIPTLAQSDAHIVEPMVAPHPVSEDTYSVSDGVSAQAVKAKTTPQSGSQVQAVEPMSKVASTVAQLADVKDETAPELMIEGDAVVACNTSCSPDSVISDIWKFLRA